MTEWTILALLIHHILRIGASTCGEPAPSANTYRTITDTGVQYRCIDNSEHVSGNLTRECVNGVYTGQPPVCEFHCGPLLNSSYANATSDGDTMGTIATYTCQEGDLIEETTTVCDANVGYWKEGDECFRNETLDHTSAVSATQSTIGTSDNVTNTSPGPSPSASDADLFNALNSIDSKVGKSLFNGDCSSTGMEQKPNINITLDALYTVYQVAVTFPEDDFAQAVSNVQVKMSSHLGHLYSCAAYNQAIAPGERVIVKCRKSRYHYWARYINIMVDFGTDLGMLQICNIEVYARPINTVDCGQPVGRPYATIRNWPTSTYYDGAATKVFYDCLPGFSVKGGRDYGYCNVNGYWTSNIVCTDEENLSLNTRAWRLGIEADILPELTDADMSTCLVIPSVTEGTVVVDMGQDIEVGDVSIAFRNVINFRDPRIVVGVWRDGIPPDYCDEYWFRWYNGETANVDCKYHPVGRYMSIRVYFEPANTLEICDVIVHGRLFTRPLECYRHSTKSDYKGTMNMTVSGIACQRWDEQEPHAHAYTDASKFPDGTLSEAANYCRNPDGKYGLWCYTTDADVPWQFCPVRYCDLFCRRDKYGSQYRGYAIYTESGTTCMKWSLTDVPFKITAHFSNWYQNWYFCRNPLSSQSKPWCYTSVDATQYEHCAIPDCESTADVTWGYWLMHAGQTMSDLLPSTQCMVWKNTFMSDGNFTGTINGAFNPSMYRRTFTIANVCRTGKVYNTTIFCYNIENNEVVWKTGVLECVHCGTPPSVDNATSSTTSGYLYGVTKFTCLSGFIYTSGGDSISCLRSGDWETPDMVCKIDCGVPPDIRGTIKEYNATVPDEIALYTCDLGYKYVSGSNISTCTESGTWVPGDAYCEVHCGTPPEVNNTIATFTTGFINTTVVFTCSPGYTKVSGSDNITCLSDSQWKQPDIYCEVDCDTPPTTVTNAAILENGTLLNNTAVYGCLEGYVNRGGQSEIICQQDGTWSEATLNCSRCDVPPDAFNATFSTSGMLIGDTAQYTCNSGFAHFNGSNSYTCSDNGTWGLLDFMCEINCGTPPEVNNSVGSNTTGFINTTVVFTCSPGYARVSGSDTITCLNTSQWEQPDTKCEGCTDLPMNVSNAVYTTTGFLIADTAEYTCNQGYAHYSGSKEIACSADATWEIPDFVCEIHCGTPPEVNNTIASDTTGFINTTVEFTCSLGFAKVSGSDNIKCLNTSQWEVPDFTCEPGCTAPPVVENADTAMNTSVINSTAVYECRDGYKDNGGVSVITCLPNTTWTQVTLNCTLPPTRDRFGRIMYRSCICRCKPPPREQADVLEEISSELILNTKELLSFSLKKESQPDERKSSTGLAYVAVAIFSVIFGTIFISDFAYFVYALRRHFQSKQR